MIQDRRGWVSASSSVIWPSSISDCTRVWSRVSCDERRRRGAGRRASHRCGASASWSSVASSAVSVVPMPARAPWLATVSRIEASALLGRGLQRVSRVGDRLGVERHQRGDRQPARDLAAGRAADPVGDCEPAAARRTSSPGCPGACMPTSLRAADAQPRTHARSSSTLRPIRIRPPTGTTTGAVTLASSMKVPLVDPTSSTSQSLPARHQPGVVVGDVVVGERDRRAVGATDRDRQRRQRDRDVPADGPSTTASWVAAAALAAPRRGRSRAGAGARARRAAARPSAPWCRRRHGGRRRRRPATNPHSSMRTTARSRKTTATGTRAQSSSRRKINVVEADVDAGRRPAARRAPTGLPLTRHAVGRAEVDQLDLAVGVPQLGVAPGDAGVLEAQVGLGGATDHGHRVGEEVRRLLVADGDDQPRAQRQRAGRAPARGLPGSRAVRGGDVRLRLRGALDQRCGPGTRRCRCRGAARS